MFGERHTPGSTSSTSGRPLVNSLLRRCATGVGLSLAFLNLHAADDAFGRLASIDFPRNQRIAFVEEQKTRLLRGAMELHGEVWLEDDGTMVMRVLEPYVEERRIEAEQLVLIRPPRRGKRDPADAIANAPRRIAPLDPSRGTHLALWAAVKVLSQDGDALRTTFTASWLVRDADDAPSQWVVELTPRDEAARRHLRSIRLYGRANSLGRIRTEHGPNRWRDMRFLK